MSQGNSVQGLTAGKLNLFFCPLENELLTPEQFELIKRWLPEDELAKVSRYIQLSARDKGLMVRGFLRGVLSLVAEQSSIDGGEFLPEDWQFEYGKKGKPKLVASQQVRSGLIFNISHSGDWLVIAVVCQTESHAMNELGVDIERYRESTNIYPILNHYFTTEESESLLALPNNKQRDRFFDLWALKESYIKAKGLGLALSLKSFSFDFSEAKTADLNVIANHEIERTLTIHNGIQLALNRGETIIRQNNWTVLFGQLNQDYRFAVSIDTATTLRVEARKLLIGELLQQGEI